MSNSTSGRLRSLFGMRKEMSFSFYMLDFIFRRLLRHNARVRYAIHHTSTIHCPHRLAKGVGVFPGDSPGVYINANNGVEIGDYSNIGPNVGIISSNHDPVNNDAFLPGEPIVIGKFCWVGMGAVILPQVRLGDFTIVGANAVVTKSFPAGYCVVAGNPAKIIRLLDKKECETFSMNKMTKGETADNE